MRVQLGRSADHQNLKMQLMMCSGKLAPCIPTNFLSILFCGFMEFISVAKVEMYGNKICLGVYCSVRSDSSNMPCDGMAS